MRVSSLLFTLTPSLVGAWDSTALLQLTSYGDDLEQPPNAILHCMTHSSVRHCIQNSTAAENLVTAKTILKQMAAPDVRKTWLPNNAEHGMRILSDTGVAAEFARRSMAFLNRSALDLILHNDQTERIRHSNLVRSVSNSLTSLGIVEMLAVIADAYLLVMYVVEPNGVQCSSFWALMWTVIGGLALHETKDHLSLNMGDEASSTAYILSMMESTIGYGFGTSHRLFHIMHAMAGYAVVAPILDFLVAMPIRQAWVDGGATPEEWSIRSQWEESKFVLGCLTAFGSVLTAAQVAMAGDFSRPKGWESLPAEARRVADAVYIVMATMSSLGYGDLSPGNPGSTVSSPVFAMMTHMYNRLVSLSSPGDMTVNHPDSQNCFAVGMVPEVDESYKEDDDELNEELRRWAQA